MNSKIHLTAQEKTRLPEPDLQKNVTRFCPKCGRKIPLDRQVCAFCENTGEIHRPVLPHRRKFVILTGIIIILILSLLFALFLTRNSGYKPSGSFPATSVPASRGTAVPVIIIR